ncbi:hypothetical protein DAI22_02g052400 [Oryza sativa Japonica Group]|jgi:hypothetical protein|nr:hypothetical protein DAI22_02g052400 [Oryza sativa Japonica Group]KAF2943261.1 hypothetical protein DAI22_02g052400 [Oryza sativa Japonica Group]
MVLATGIYTLQLSSAGHEEQQAASYIYFSLILKGYIYFGEDRSVHG